MLHRNAVKEEGNTTNAMQSYWIRQAQHKHASNPETLKRGEKKKNERQKKEKRKGTKKKTKNQKKGGNKNTKKN